MSRLKGSSKKRRSSESETSKSEIRKRVLVEDDFDPEISNDIKGLVSALQQIKEKAHMDGRKKKEETISSVTSEIKSKLDELKSKIEKERQSFAKALSKSSKECENSLKSETNKFQALYERYRNEKDAHLQALKDILSRHEEEKEGLFMRYEQQRKKEKGMISEHEKAFASKIAELEEMSLEKKKQDNKTFIMLRKTIDSIWEPASDEDFPADD